jgi:hypothetical protein
MVVVQFDGFSNYIIAQILGASRGTSPTTPGTKTRNCCIGWKLLNWMTTLVSSSLDCIDLAGDIESEIGHICAKDFPLTGG